MATSILVRVLLMAGVIGCQQDSVDLDGSVATYRDRMLTQATPERGRSNMPPTQPPTLSWRGDDPPVVRPAAGQEALPVRQSLMTQRTAAPSSQPTTEELLQELPDPSNAPAVFAARLARLEKTATEDRVVRNYRKVMAKAEEYLQLLSRPRAVRINLAECIQRAIEHNYAIRAESFNPAISQTQIVQAEAVFDAEFFLDSSYALNDPAIPPKQPSQITDNRSISGGLRQLLPTGMQVSTQLQQNFTRIKKDLKTPPYTSHNYDTAFITQFTQPLLRGFGLDYNRRQITLSRIGRDASYQQFLQQVRDTLLSVESAYWRLVQTRRNSAILAETVSQNYVTWQDLLQRKEHDATPVEINNAQSQFQSRYVAFLETLKNVRDAEDALKNLINDAEFKLSDDMELIPTDDPFTLPLVLDQFAEVRTALERRNEIEQAKLNIESQRVQTAAAKNETLPRLDLSFQYQVQGLAEGSDGSFDNMTTNRFTSYAVSAMFSYPLGNRGPEAALRRARLQESQAIVQLHRVTDSVVQEVNDAVRTLIVRWAQVSPQYLAVKAADLNLRALQARTQRIDPSYLNTELNGVEQLGNTRTTLLSVLTTYTTAIVELERAKGTLLDYNNIAVTDERRGR